MNKFRREQLQGIYDRLDSLKEEVEVIKGMEEEAKDNIPESLQGTERYEKSEAACEAMDCAVSSIDEAMSHIAEVTEE